jgi:predicted metalloprotease
MKWEDLQRSRNVRDRRSSSPRRRSSGAGLGGAGLGGLGIGGVLIVVVLSLIFGQNPLTVLGLLQGGTQTRSAPQSESVPRTLPTGTADEQRDFVSAILGDTEVVWNNIFEASDLNYPEPELVLFSDAVASACGNASAAMGPFYCSLDSRVYIDLSFFNTLSETAAQEADFARAYVIAHEVGHHVQNVLGILPEVTDQRRRVSEVESNELSVRLELQADCYAGVWGHYANQRDLLERGDIREAIDAATAVGDDRLQRQRRGYVVPDSFTHGSSEQRVRWFRQGLETGDPSTCDTFGMAGL